VSDGRWRPGPILTWLAERLVAPEVREEFVGDLVEEAGKREGPRAALWFAGQLLLSAPALLQWRIRRSARGGRGAVLLGLSFAVLWTVAQIVDARPLWIGLLVLGAWLNAAGAVLIWKRTPFRLLAAATGLGALELIGVAALLPFVSPDRLVEHPAVWIAAAVSVVVYWLVWIRSRRSRPEAWSRWRSAAEETGMLGFLVFEHIPDLSGRAPE